MAFPATPPARLNLYELGSNQNSEIRFCQSFFQLDATIFDRVAPYYVLQLIDFRWSAGAAVLTIPVGAE